MRYLTISILEQTFPHPWVSTRQTIQWTGDPRKSQDDPSIEVCKTLELLKIFNRPWNRILRDGPEELRVALKKIFRDNMTNIQEVSEAKLAYIRMNL